MQGHNPEALMAEEANAEVVLLGTSPDGQWHEIWSKQYNRSYYFNVTTNETTWIRPSAFDAQVPIATATTPSIPSVSNPIYITANTTKPPVMQFAQAKVDEGGVCVFRFIAAIMLIIAGSMLASVWGMGGFLIGQQNCACVYYSGRSKCSYQCGPLLMGVGVFYASYVEYSPAPGFQAKSFVKWTDFNTANACQQNTSIFNDYTLPNGFCVNKGTNVNGSAQYEFTLPSSIVALPGLLITACILSWVGCILGVTSGAFATPRSRIVPLLVCFTAMACCIASFALFTQIPLFTSYQDRGNTVPLKTLSGELRASNTTVTLPLSQYYGLVVTSFIFITLGTCCFSCGRFSTRREKELAQDRFEKIQKQNDIVLQ